MVSVKPSWWSYVKHIVKEYPRLCGELEELKKTRVTISYGEHTRGNGKIFRPVEEAALRMMEPNKQKKYEAVTKALEITKRRYPLNGGDRLRIIEMVYFGKNYSITKAAMIIPCHMNTASRWQSDFLRLVADILELP